MDIPDRLLGNHADGEVGTLNLAQLADTAGFEVHHDREHVATVVDFLGLV